MKNKHIDPGTESEAFLQGTDIYISFDTFSYNYTQVKQKSACGRVARIIKKGAFHVPFVPLFSHMFQRAGWEFMPA